MLVKHEENKLKKYMYRISLLFFMFLFFSSFALSQPCERCYKDNEKMRVQTIKTPYVGKSIGFSLETNYYFGDIELSNKTTMINPNGISLDAKIFYNHPLNDHFSFRPALLFGWIKSSDAKRKDGYNKGKFSTILVESSVGIEYFPTLKTGFYLYLGVCASLAMVNYDYTPSQRSSGFTTQIAPSALLEIGYKFPLIEKWSMGFNFSFHQLLMDTKLSGLDGYYAFVKKNNRWNDGFYSFGINFYYNFNTRWSKQYVKRKK